MKKRSGEKRRKREPQLKPRQQKLLDGILKGKSTRQAAKDAGYKRGADHPGELLNTAAMRQALRRRLPSVELIALRVTQGLSAKKTEFAKFEGKITDSRDCVDHHERRRFAELACRLHGLLEMDENGDPQRIVVNIVRNAALKDIRTGAAFGKSYDGDSESDA